MAWYNVGTVTVTASSGTVTGAGTDFITNVRVGDGFTVVGSTTIYEITNIASATQITISPVFTGTAGSGKAYAIVPIQGYVKTLADQVRALLNSTPVSGYAPIDSPTFTGDPRAPTPASSDNDTSIATTAFVQAQKVNTTLTGTTTINTLNAGAIAGASLASSSTVVATGDINSKTGFTAFPVTDGTTASTLFTKADTANSGYLQMAATPTGMNIVSGRTGTGAYLPLLIMAGGVQRMRFEANGVISFPTGGTRFQADFSNADNNLRAAFQTNIVNGGTVFNVIPNGTSTTSNVVCHNTQDMNNAGRIRIAMSGGEAQLISDATGTGVNQPLGIYTNGIRRMLFQPSGEIILGAASSNGMWNGSVNNPGLIFDPVNYTQVIQTPNTNMSMSKFGVGNGILLGFWVSGTGIGSISCSASSTSYNTASDYRLKRDVREMPDCRAYFKELRPVLHYWNNPDADNTLPTAGFIAHELQEVFPQMVHGDKDGVDEDGNPVYQGVDYGKLTPYLSAATKSLIEENEQQAEQIASLQEENATQAEELRVLKLQMAAVLEHLNLTVETAQ